MHISNGLVFVLHWLLEYYGVMHADLAGTIKIEANVDTLIPIFACIMNDEQINSCSSFIMPAVTEQMWLGCAQVHAAPQHTMQTAACACKQMYVQRKQKEVLKK